MYHEFVVPGEGEMERVLGVTVEPTGETGVSVFTVSDNRIRLRFTIDVLGRAVGVSLSPTGSDVEVATLYWEGATRLWVAESPRELVVEFEPAGGRDGLKGTLKLSLAASIVLEMTNLFV